MTRAYALHKLLQHGPLTRREITVVMGGKRPGAALDSLQSRGVVIPVGHTSTPSGRVYLYGLA